MSQIPKHISVKVPVSIFKEDEEFIAYCPALDLGSTGDSPADAKKAFEEVLQIFMEETIRTGTLEKALLTLGWTLRQKPLAQYTPPKEHSTKFTHTTPLKSFTEEVRVPLYA